MRNIVLAVILTAAVVGAGAFYGGMQYSQSRQRQGSENFQSRFNGTRTGAGAGARGAGNFAGGQVVSLDAKSMTVKAPDNSSRIVFIGDATVVAKTVPGALSDIKIGDTISVQGSTNTDGSINAQTIQIRQIASSSSPMQQH